MKHWKDEGVILDILTEVKWATGQAWAPAIATKNGRNYLNDDMISFDHQAVKRLNRKATMKASLALSGMASIISVGVSMILAIYANQLSMRHPSHAGDHQEVRILTRKTSIALQRLNH